MAPDGANGAVGLDRKAVRSPTSESCRGELVCGPLLDYEGVCTAYCSCSEGAEDAAGYGHYRRCAANPSTVIRARRAALRAPRHPWRSMDSELKPGLCATNKFFVVKLATSLQELLDLPSVS